MDNPVDAGPSNLFNMSDDEIRAAAGIFSYDLEACMVRLKKGDDWQRVIQAHLFFDHVLSAMISEAMTAPNHLSLDRTAFATKLDLCASLGLLDGETKSFLKRTNRLRNVIAHNLEFKVSRDDVADLYAASSDEAKELIGEQKEKLKGTLLFRVFLVNLVLLDVLRQNWAAKRLFEAKRKHGLEAALENGRRVLAKVEGEIAARKLAP